MLVAIVAAATLTGAVPSAVADHEPCWDHAEHGPFPMLRAQVEHGSCGGESWIVAVNDPNGRTEVVWYEDQRGVGLEVHRAPRFVAWWSSDEGCVMMVYTFGADELPCVAGAPPAPPVLPVPWLLP